MIYVTAEKNIEKGMFRAYVNVKTHINKFLKITKFKNVKCDKKYKVKYIFINYNI